MSDEMTDEELAAIEARVEADGPGEPYECIACGKPYDPAAECDEGPEGSECEEPDPDDVCRDDRARLCAALRAERERAENARTKLKEARGRLTPPKNLCDEGALHAIAAALTLLGEP